ncbi:hypothetical protein BC830DRAFT_1089873 [Chytriomyces sp. MP71]|nr:hypothetical protein BC830DRAFT_1089873 [Chytriomyces sp. MP71]
MEEASPAETRRNSAYALASAKGSISSLSKESKANLPNNETILKSVASSSARLAKGSPLSHSRESSNNHIKTAYGKDDVSRKSSDKLSSTVPNSQSNLANTPLLKNEDERLSKQARDSRASPKPDSRTASRKVSVVNEATKPIVSPKINSSKPISRSGSASNLLKSKSASTAVVKNVASSNRALEKRPSVRQSSSSLHQSSQASQQSFYGSNVTLSKDPSKMSIASVDDNDPRIQELRNILAQTVEVPDNEEVVGTDQWAMDIVQQNDLAERLELEGEVQVNEKLEEEFEELCWELAKYIIREAQTDLEKAKKEEEVVEDGYVENALAPVRSSVIAKSDSEHVTSLKTTSKSDIASEPLKSSSKPMSRTQSRPLSTKQASPKPGSKPLSISNSSKVLSSEGTPETMKSGSAEKLSKITAVKDDLETASQNRPEGFADAQVQPLTSSSKSGAKSTSKTSSKLGSKPHSKLGSRAMSKSALSQEPYSESTENDKASQQTSDQSVEAARGANAVINEVGIPRSSAPGSKRLSKSGSNAALSSPKPSSRPVSAKNHLNGADFNNADVASQVGAKEASLPPSRAVSTIGLREETTLVASHDSYGSVPPQETADSVAGSKAALLSKSGSRAAVTSSKHLENEVEGDFEQSNPTIQSTETKSQTALTSSKKVSKSILHGSNGSFSSQKGVSKSSSKHATNPTSRSDSLAALKKPNGIQKEGAGNVFARTGEPDAIVQEGHLPENHGGSQQANRANESPKISTKRSSVVGPKSDSKITSRAGSRSVLPTGSIRTLQSDVNNPDQVGSRTASKFASKTGSQSNVMKENVQPPTTSKKSTLPSSKVSSKGPSRVASNQALAQVQHGEESSGRAFEYPDNGQKVVDEFAYDEPFQETVVGDITAEYNVEMSTSKENELHPVESGNDAVEPIDESTDIETDEQRLEQIFSESANRIDSSKRKSAAQSISKTSAQGEFYEEIPNEVISKELEYDEHFQEEDVLDTEPVETNTEYELFDEAGPKATTNGSKSMADDYYEENEQNFSKGDKNRQENKGHEQQESSELNRPDNGLKNSANEYQDEADYEQYDERESSPKIASKILSKVPSNVASRSPSKIALAEASLNLASKQASASGSKTNSKIASRSLSIAANNENHEEIATVGSRQDLVKDSKFELKTKPAAEERAEITGESNVGVQDSTPNPHPTIQGSLGTQEENLKEVLADVELDGPEHPANKPSKPTSRKASAANSNSNLKSGSRSFSQSHVPLNETNKHFNNEQVLDNSAQMSKTVSHPASKPGSKLASRSISQNLLTKAIISDPSAPGINKTMSKKSSLNGSRISISGDKPASKSESARRSIVDFERNPNDAFDFNDFDLGIQSIKPSRPTTAKLSSRGPNNASQGRLANDTNSPQKSVLSKQGSERNSKISIKKDSNSVGQSYNFEDFDASYQSDMAAQTSTQVEDALYDHDFEEEHKPPPNNSIPDHIVAESLAKTESTRTSLKSLRSQRSSLINAQSISQKPQLSLKDNVAVAVHANAVDDNSSQRFFTRTHGVKSARRTIEALEVKDLDSSVAPPSRGPDINYIGLVANLRRELAILKKEMGIRDDAIVSLKEREHDLRAYAEASRAKGKDSIDKNTRILLDRQKKAYQILVAKLRREIRRLNFQKNSLSDPLIESKYFPYLPRTPYGSSARTPPIGIIGNLPQRSSDYFPLNPPPPTGNHIESGNRWWWGSGPDLSSHIPPRKNSKKNAVLKTPDGMEHVPDGDGSNGNGNDSQKMPAISTRLQQLIDDYTQGEAKVGDRGCVVINGERVLGMIKYVGLFDPYPESGLWCGIKLDRPLGKHDGVVRGKRYFSCEENHGLFVKLDKIIPMGPAGGKRQSTSKASAQQAQNV